MTRKRLFSGLLVIWLAALPLAEAHAVFGYIPGADIKKDPLVGVSNPSLENQVLTDAADVSGLPLGAFQVDTLTGAATVQYPFKLAPGRHGLEPDLFLSYNSQNKNNTSPTGYGWDLAQAYIQRNDRLGVNHLYDNTNEFQLNLFGESGELVPITLTDATHGTYGKRVEDTFYRYEFQTNNTWLVTDQNGVEYTFGTGNASRQYDPAVPSRIYKWMLEEIRDPNQNWVRFMYFKDQNQIYLWSMNYTGFGPSSLANDGPFSVIFSYQNRPDAMVTYRPGFRVVNQKRLTQVALNIQNSTAGRTWNLGYTAGDNGTRSLLTSITSSTTDEQGGTLTLNPTTFTYSSSHPDGAMNWSVTPNSVDRVPVEFVNGGGGDTGARITDANGDGYADILTSSIPDTSYVFNACDHPVYCNYVASLSIFLNNLNDAWTNVTTPSQWPINVAFTERQLELLDLNGDALPEIYRQNYPNESGITWGYKLNTGAGFAQNAGNSLDNVTYTPDTGFRYVDVNGDGWDDKVFGASAPFLNPYSGNPGGEVYLNNGRNVWVRDLTWTVPRPIAFGPFLQADSGFRFADVNGDGLMDAVVSAGYDNTDNDNWPNGPPIAELYLNNGINGWTLEPGWNFGVTPLSGVYYQNAVTGWSSSSSNDNCLYDLNGDGLMDWAGAIGNGTNGWVNNFIPAVNRPRCGGLVGLSAYAAYRSLDINGDGLTDSFETTTNANDTLRLSTEVLPDLLTGMATPLGGTTAVTYTLSTKYEDANGALLNPRLPMPMSTVSQVVEGDGLGGTSIKTYTYSGGRYHRYGTFRSEFAGFAQTVETQGSRVTTLTFDQGCGAVESCSHAAYSTGTLLQALNDPTIWIVDGGYRRAFPSWPDFVNSGFTLRRVQIVDESVINALPQGTNWIEPSTFIYTSSLGNYARKGKLLRRQVTSISGTLYRLETSSYNVTSLGNGRYYPSMIRAIFFDYDGQVLPRTRATLYTHNTTTGRVTSEQNLGEVLANATMATVTNMLPWDERTTNTTYSIDTTNWIVKPNVVTVLNNAAVQVAATDYNYDANGNLIQEQKWLNTTGGWVTTQIAVNAKGLPVTVTNPRGFATTFTYDAYTLYPASSTNALQHATQFTYDYLNGQPKSVTDPNGFTGVTTYDAWGRTLSRSVPDPTTGATTALSNAVYVMGSVPAYETLSTTVGGVLSQARLFRDGWGRPVRAWSSGEDGQNAVTDVWYDAMGRVSRQSLPYFSTTLAWALRNLSNPATTTTYDLLDRPLVQTAPVGTTSHTYNRWNETVIDPNGTSKDFEVDAHGQMVLLVEHNGPSLANTEYFYDALGRLTQRMDANSNMQYFFYDSLSRRTSQQNLHAQNYSGFGVWSTTYDANGNAVTRTNPAGQVVAWSYDALDRPIGEDQFNNGVDEFVFVYDTASNGVGKPASVTGPNHAITFAYDAQGNMTQEVKTVEGSTAATSFAYDLAGRPMTVTYPNGALTLTNAYNELGRIEAVTRSVPGAPMVTDYDYNALAQVTAAAYGNGAGSTWTYDPAQNYRLIAKSTDAIFDSNPPPPPPPPPPPTDTDGDGLPDSILSATNFLNPYLPDPSYLDELTYTGTASLVTVFPGPPPGPVYVAEVEYLLDPVTNPSGSWVSATPVDGTFDELVEDYAFTTPTLSPGAHDILVRFFYTVGDISFQESMSVQATDQVTITTFPAGGPPPSEPLPPPPPPIDTDGDLLDDTFESATFNTDPAQFDTDGNGLPDSIWAAPHVLNPQLQDPTMATELDYTGTASITAPYSVLIPGPFHISGVDYAVDVASNPSAPWTPVTPSDGAFDEPVESYSFTVTGLSSGTHRVSTRLQLTVGSTTFLVPQQPFDEVTVTAPALPPPGPIQDQDNDGLPDELDDCPKSWPLDEFDQIYPNGCAWSESDTDGDGYTDYDERLLLNSDPMDPDSPDASANRRQASALLRAMGRAVVRVFLPATAHATPVPGSVQSLEYSYDAGGSVTSIEDTGITGTAKTATYAYDDLNRLTSASTTGFAAGDYSQTFQYDAIGNMVYRSDVGAMVYNGNGNFTPHTLTRANGVTRNYNANGDMLTDGTNSYAWTLKNELQTVTTPSGVHNYTYDVSGQRLTATDPSGNTTRYFGPYYEERPGERVYYVYAGAERIAEYHVPDDANGDPGDPATGILLTLHTDHLGSTQVTTNETGTVMDVLDTEPFGDETLNASYGTPNTAYSYTGKELNADTGLYYFEARWMDPALGRFISMDPFPRRAPEIMLADPQSWNAYAYARNNPVNFTDPSGEMAVDDAVDGGYFVYDTGKWFYNTGKGLIAAVKGDFSAADGYFDEATQNAKDALTDAAFAMVPGVSATGIKLVDDVAGAVKAKGILANAAKGSGNFGLGSSSFNDALTSGKAWVGNGYKVASDGKTLVSKDGLRQFRPPTFKPSLGKTQANFEWRSKNSGQWQGNGHLDVE